MEPAVSVVDVETTPSTPLSGQKRAHTADHDNPTTPQRPKRLRTEEYIAKSLRARPAFSKYKLVVGSPKRKAYHPQRRTIGKCIKLGLVDYIPLNH